MQSKNMLFISNEPKKSSGRFSFSEKTAVPIQLLNKSPTEKIIKTPTFLKDDIISLKDLTNVQPSPKFWMGGSFGNFDEPDENKETHKGLFYEDINSSRNKHINKKKSVKKDDPKLVHDNIVLSIKSLSQKPNRKRNTSNDNLCSTLRSKKEIQKKKLSSNLLKSSHSINKEEISRSSILNEKRSSSTNISKFIYIENEFTKNKQNYLKDSGVKNNFTFNSNRKIKKKENLKADNRIKDMRPVEQKLAFTNNFFINRSSLNSNNQPKPEYSPFMIFNTRDKTLPFSRDKKVKKKQIKRKFSTNTFFSKKLNESKKSFDNQNLFTKTLDNFPMNDFVQVKSHEDSHVQNINFTRNSDLKQILLSKEKQTPSFQRCLSTKSIYNQPKKSLSKNLFQSNTKKKKKPMGRSEFMKNPNKNFNKIDKNCLSIIIQNVEQSNKDIFNKLKQFETHTKIPMPTSYSQFEHVKCKMAPFNSKYNPSFKIPQNQINLEKMISTKKEKLVCSDSSNDLAEKDTDLMKSSLFLSNSSKKEEKKKSPIKSNKNNLHIQKVKPFCYKPSLNDKNLSKKTTTNKISLNYNIQIKNKNINTNFFDNKVQKCFKSKQANKRPPSTFFDKMGNCAMSKENELRKLLRQNRKDFNHSSIKILSNKKNKGKKIHSHQKPKAMPKNKFGKYKDINDYLMNQFKEFPFSKSKKVNNQFVNRNSLNITYNNNTYNDPFNSINQKHFYNNSKKSYIKPKDSHFF